MLTDLFHARTLDAGDQLAGFRDQFVIAEPELIYLDGNSLGRLPRRAVERVRHVVEHEWGARLVRGWNEGWFTAPQRVGAKIARMIGAGEDEVIVCDSTSVNLFKLMVAALQARSGRRKVVTDELNFPSDVTVLQGALRLLGANHELVILRSQDGITIPPEALASAIDSDTALVVLTHTAFKTGFVHDLRQVTEFAHRAGALMLWDLCHSVGVLPLDLNAAGVDLAVGCGYKYLNGGPGAPAFLFVRRELQDELASPIWGWWGQQGMFDFSFDYAPAEGMTRWLAGTPNLLSLAALEASVELVLEAGLDRIRSKSIAQTEYLIGLWEAWLRPLGVALNSPRDSNRRGSHVSFGHPEGWRINQALLEAGVIPDFRPTDTLRFGCAPLYTSFAELHEAMTRLRTILVERGYESFSQARAKVT